MSEKKNTTKMVKIIDELKNGLGATTNKELAQCMDCSEATISRYIKQEFKEVQWSKERIYFWAVYFGEEIDSDIEQFKENIWKELSVRGENYKESLIIKRLEKEFNDDEIARCIANAKVNVKKRYDAAQNGNLQKSDEERKAIQGYIIKKFPSIQCENNDSEIMSAKAESPASQINPMPAGVGEGEACVKMPAENEGVIKDAEQEKITEKLENEKTAPNSIKDNLNNTIETEEDLDGSEKDEKNSNIVGGIVLPRGAQVHLEAEKEYQVACSQKNTDEYIQHLQCAAELGHPEAMYRLGIAYINGEGVIHDSQKAVNYFFMAGKMGSADAVNQLRFCYMEGNGVEKNEMKAIWLLNILRKIQYQPRKSVVDISLDKSTKLKNNYKKEFKKFVPETDDDYKIQELVYAWKKKS